MSGIKNKSYSSDLWKKKLKKFVNNKLAMVGLIVVILILSAIILAPLLTKYDPNEINFSNGVVPPCAEHLLGTDKLGRDVFARVLYGGRISCFIALFSALIGATIGVILGSIAGYYGKTVDWILVRTSEIFQTIPQMVLILVVMAFLGTGIKNLIIIFSITGWMGTFRLVRAEFVSLKEETFVEVCRAFGMSETAIMFKQILPSVLSIVIVAITTNIPQLILMEAGLSYLGVGVPVTVPTWGNILNAAKSVEVVSNYYWLWAVPGGLISVLVLAINFLGDGLRDVLDPRQQ